MINYVTFKKQIDIGLEVDQIGKRMYHECTFDAFREFLDSFSQAFLDNSESGSFSQEIIDNPHLETAINDLSDNSKYFILAMAAEISKDFPTKSLTNDLYIILADEETSDKLQIVKDLVAKGANINYRPPNNNINFSAAYLCVLWESPEILKYLISVGLDISIPCSISQGGDTAIVCARRTNNKEILEILEAAQKPVEAVEEHEEKEEEESTETFYKVGDRFVLNTKVDFCADGNTFEIISGQENSVVLKKIDGNFHRWVNKYGAQETTVTDTNKITEAEWYIITDDRDDCFTKLVKVEEPKEEQEPAPVENEVFYHVGQTFKFKDSEDSEEILMLCTNKSTKVRSEKGNVREYFLNVSFTAISGRKKGNSFCSMIWTGAALLSCIPVITQVDDIYKITQAEFEEICNGSADKFTLIDDE